MYILRENNNDKLKVTRTENFADAIIHLAKSTNPTELFEKGKGLNAKRLGFINFKEEFEVEI